MTKKKYILTFIIFIALLIAALILFFSGIFLKEENTTVFYVLAVFACISFISAIAFIACNYKKLVAYDVIRIENKIKALDFSVIELSVDARKLCEKLKSHRYQKISENMYYKRVEDDVGDGGIVVSHYYAALLQIDKTIDISKHLEQINKGMTTYNIGYIFPDKNLESNLEALKKYIKETVVDIEIHRYGYKNFFVPIVISNGKIFYLKTGSIISEYRRGLSEGLRILNSY